MTWPLSIFFSLRLAGLTWLGFFRTSKMWDPPGSHTEVGSALSTISAKQWHLGPKRTFKNKNDNHMFGLFLGLSHDRPWLLLRFLSGSTRKRRRCAQARSELPCAYGVGCCLTVVIRAGTGTCSRSLNSKHHIPWLQETNWFFEILIWVNSDTFSPANSFK
jgi:hypothetical protein